MQNSEEEEEQEPDSEFIDKKDKDANQDTNTYYSSKEVIVDKTPPSKKSDTKRVQFDISEDIEGE